MKTKEYKIRYKTILSMELTEIEKVQMVVGFLADIERVLASPANKSELLFEEKEKLRAFYREVLLELGGEKMREF